MHKLHYAFSQPHALHEFKHYHRRCVDWTSYAYKGESSPLHVSTSLIPMSVNRDHGYLRAKADARCRSTRPKEAESWATDFNPGATKLARGTHLVEVHWRSKGNPAPSPQNTKSTDISEVEARSQNKSVLPSPPLATHTHPFFPSRPSLDYVLSV